VSDRDLLGAELNQLEQKISAWCQKMAWPGGMPTPPVDVWERRSEIYSQLKQIGVKTPRFEHIRWRERQR
jgi:hypothetical protein